MTDTMTESNSMIERRTVRSITDTEMMAFIADHRLPQLYMEPEFLLGLASSPARVIDLWQEGKRTFVGVVIDTCENATNAAEFVALACLQETIGLALFECALKTAEAEAAQTSYANLEIGAEGSLRSFEPLLQDHGFTEAYTMVRMWRADAVHAAPPLDAVWRWHDLTRETVLPARHLLMAAFAGIPGMNFRQENFEDEQIWKTAPPVRLLFHGDDLAGYVSVLPEPDGSGMVNIIARHPRYRGQNTGAILMDEALKLLAASAVSPVRLNVMAQNDRALELYRKFGFATDYAVAIYSLGLRHSASAP